MPSSAVIVALLMLSWRYCGTRWWQRFSLCLFLCRASAVCCSPSRFKFCHWRLNCMVAHGCIAVKNWCQVLPLLGIRSYTPNVYDFHGVISTTLSAQSGEESGESVAIKVASGDRCKSAIHRLWLLCSSYARAALVVAIFLPGCSLRWTWEPCTFVALG